MLDKIIPGLVLAMVSGISFIAYRHPKIYGLVSRHMYTLFIVASCSLSAWNLAITMTRIAMDPFVDPSKGTLALAAVRTLEIPFPWLFVGFIGIWLYLVLLDLLPLLLKYEEDQKPKTEGKPSEQKKLK
jgi:hypothetical protein